MRPFGSARELENRRRLAVTRVLEGYSQAEVARFLDVNVRTVRPCVADYRRDGDTGLATKAPLGRTPKLSPEQERIVLGWFRKNPTEFGSPTGVIPKCGHAAGRLARFAVEVCDISSSSTSSAFNSARQSGGVQRHALRRSRVIAS
jgi:hypothetical protein